MLHWFAKRFKELHEKDAKGEKGFTLIELLVVVIIIGVLAAIAIPVFLNQRTKAQDAACLSDVRNGAAAATAYAADHNGSYNATPAMTADLLHSTYGWNFSEGVTDQSVDTATASDFSLSATSASGAGCQFVGGQASMTTP